MTKAERLTWEEAWERPAASQRMPADLYREYRQRRWKRAEEPVVGFVPVGEELDRLVEYWLADLIDIDWCVWCGQGWGSSEQWRALLATDRLDALEAALGQEVFSDAFEAAVKRYGRRIDPSVWEAFLRDDEVPDDRFAEANPRIGVLPQSALHSTLEYGQKVSDGQTKEAPRRSPVRRSRNRHNVGEAH